MSFWIRPVLRLQRVHHRATEITTQDVRRWMSHSADAARALLGVRCGANPAELEQAYLESIKRIKETAPSPLIAVHVAELSQALQVLTSQVAETRAQQSPAVRQAGENDATGKDDARATAAMVKAKAYAKRQELKREGKEEAVPRWVELKRDINTTLSRVFSRLQDGDMDRESIEHRIARFESEIKGLNATIDDYNLMVPMQRMQMGRVSVSMTEKAISDLRAGIR